MQSIATLKDKLHTITPKDTLWIQYERCYSWTTKDWQNGWNCSVALDAEFNSDMGVFVHGAREVLNAETEFTNRSYGEINPRGVVTDLYNIPRNGFCEFSVSKINLKKINAHVVCTNGAKNIGIKTTRLII